MTATPPVARRRTEVADALGLHLRPAARFAEMAGRFSADVRVRCGDAEADGKSVLSLVCLAAGTGSALDLEAHGPDAEEAVVALADLVSGRPPGASGQRCA